MTIITAILTIASVDVCETHLTCCIKDFCAPLTQECFEDIPATSEPICVQELNCSLESLECNADCSTSLSVCRACEGQLNICKGDCSTEHDACIAEGTPPDLCDDFTVGCLDECTEDFDACMENVVLSLPRQCQ
ncbi:MAG: hypothetical protein MJA83_05545 [Gammaproteobacteria bacterium]|nr:hypothetical protein [Gammaproteobacteria bacterium]